MVAHFPMRTHGVNQIFRFVEGIWLHRKSRQIRFFFSEKDLVFIIRAQREMSNHLILKPWEFVTFKAFKHLLHFFCNTIFFDHE